MLKYFNILLLLATFSTALFAQTSVDTDKWQTYEPQGGGFSINMPEMPAEVEETVESEGGGYRTIYLAMLERINKDGNQTYSVAYSDYPPKIHADSLDAAALNQFFEAVISEELETVNAKVDSTESWSIEDFPGREVAASLTDGKGIAIYRLYLVKNRLYTIQVHLANKAHHSAVSSFLDSFQLVEEY